MKTNNIVFIADSFEVTNEDHSTDPIPIVKTLPDWYKKAHRYYKMPSGENYKDHEGNLIHSWKSCPAIYDVISAGYVFRTPCDLEFYKENGIPRVKILDDRFPNFVQERPPMPEFTVPYGYHDFHFAWYGEWAVRLPKGYSALYTQPLNRYELPFHSTNGIIDSDVVNLFGTVPFFLAKDWDGGILPAGTPFLQIFPFKRENWKAEYEYPDHMQIYNDNMLNIQKYRTTKGGVYLNKVWQRRKYE
jgi:hypothetical protein